MAEKINNIILDSTGKISKRLNRTPYIISKGDRRLPGRSATIEILKDLRRVMFPGFFGDENITVIDTDYFIGDCLTRIYVSLKNEVKTAFYYRDYDKMSLEEIERHAEEVCEKFFERLPQVQELLLKDVEAGFDGDPAAKSKEDVVISYPGLFAVFVYRIAHEFYVQDVPLLPRIMTEYAHSRTGIDINSGATIGEYFFIDHGTGVVIGETTEIGSHVKLYQGVTLGALSTKKGQQLRGKKRHPTIEDNVTVYSNASILGGETVVGEGAIVSGGAFVTSSVPPHTKVIVKNPELQFKGSDKTVVLDSIQNDAGTWVI